MAVTGFAAGIWNVGFLCASYVDVRPNHLLDDLFSFGRSFYPSYVKPCNLDFLLFGIFVGTILSFSLLGILASSVNFLM